MIITYYYHNNDNEVEKTISCLGRPSLVIPVSTELVTTVS